MAANLAVKKARCGVANPRHTARYVCGLRLAAHFFALANFIHQNKSALP
jgi:hypothetical protein